MRFYQSLAPPDTPSEMSIETKVGSTAVVTKKVIANEKIGKVKIKTEEFRATSEQDIEEGTKVKVIHAEGITLTVVVEE